MSDYFANEHSLKDMVWQMTIQNFQIFKKQKFVEKNVISIIDRWRLFGFLFKSVLIDELKNELLKYFRQILHKNKRREKLTQKHLQAFFKLYFNRYLRYLRKKDNLI